MNKQENMTPNVEKKKISQKWKRTDVDIKISNKKIKADFITMLAYVPTVEKREILKKKNRNWTYRDANYTTFGIKNPLDEFMANYMLQKKKSINSKTQQ